MDNLDLIFSEITNNIKVTAIPSYNKQGSNESDNIHIWFYYIRIENLGNSTIQVLKRHWQIYDSNGKVEEVRGEGIVGYQPVIKPNEFFEYKSHVRLFSTSGLMKGNYSAKNYETYEEFIINIPAFSLDLNISLQKFN